MSGADGGHAALWSNLTQGTNIQQVVPLERWDIDAFYNPDGPAGSQYMRFGAFIQVQKSGAADVKVMIRSLHSAVEHLPGSSLDI